ncbi:MAG: 23S rRNA (pseudouridine(1915)-N(3))-methyltransferase RlmH [Clostridia bacterium]|nr:23S rRNA (pseudouridine(1915)-N(3))-methyltransferase RlmH [Candidatus Methanomethylophilaceae archaeon]MBQ4289711.1 23S rRNA (pseudouridine(1915)-N(3))-methyltransferase RlmH [Clostridia bacterium]
MIRVSLIAVGSLKESYLREAFEEYRKRLGSYVSFSLNEIREERLSPSPSPAEIRSALEREGERISEAIPPRSYRIALCIEGSLIDSVSFASRLSELSASGVSSFAFLIGGSYGLSEAVKRSADWKLSFSPMTFPHQLMRVILTEQLYRAMNLSGGGKYHK